MKQNSVLLRTFGVAFIALTLVGAAFRSLAFVFSFDPEVGYFDAGIFSTLLYIAIVLVLVAAAAYARLIRIAEKSGSAPILPDPAATSLALRITSWAVAAAFAVAAVLELLYSETLPPLTLLRLISAVLAVPYFVKPTKKSACFGLAAQAYCILSMATEYFDHYVTMNSPFKLMQQFAALAIVLYLLTELNAQIGVRQPRRALPLGLLAAFFSLTNGISCIVAAIVGIIPTTYLIRAVVLLALGWYISARLIYTARHQV